jgi:gliding motility-associated-like protein
MDPTPSIEESESDTFRINGLMAGIYSVSITDDRGCSANIDFTIDQPDLLVIQGCMPIMDGENISLTIVGGNGGYSYSITNEIGDIYQNGGTGTFLNLSNLQIGINTVTVTDTLGCTISCVIPVSDEDCLLEINITGNDVSCAGENDGSAAVVITQAGTPPYIFEWSNGATTSSLNNISAGSYSVTVTESDNPDCRDTASITIDVEEPPFLIVNNIEFLCPGDELSINVVGGYDSYIWSTGEISSSIIVNESGFYGVTVTDGDCSFNDLIQVIEVDISNLPLADAGPDAIIRENFYVLGGNDVQGIDDMVWTSNNDEIDFGDSTAFDSDVYNLDYCDNTFIWTLSTEQCTYSSDDVTIYNIEDSEVSVVNDTFFMINDGTVLDTVFNSGGIINVQDLGLVELELPKHGINFELNEDESFIYQPEEDFIGIDSFKYQIFDTECEIISDLGTVYIFVNPPLQKNICSNPFFSPNGDDFNPYLVFDELESNQFPNNRLVIFDQNGKTIFKAEPYNNNWDGNIGGRAIPDGPYFYLLWFNEEDKVPCQGHIAVLTNR